MDRSKFARSKSSEYSDRPSGTSPVKYESLEARVVAGKDVCFVLNGFRLSIGARPD